MNILKEARQKKALSQRDISERLGYNTPQFVSNWERGLSAPPIESLNQISEILELDVSQVRNYVFNFRANKIAEKVYQDQNK